MAIIRPVPKIYDFVGALRTQLSSAYAIEESGEFGQISTLRFRYPYYLVDANGNTIYKEDGTPEYDPRINTIINEFLVEFNNDWYIIKNVEEGRNSDGSKFINVGCVGKADELTFKQIKYINLSPPIHAPVDAKQAILEVITYPFQVDLGYGKITAVAGNVVTLGVDTTFNFAGYKIATLEGTGKYQQRKIVSYNTTTKQATLDTAFSPQVNTTTVFRVHNSKYTLGYVDPLLINDGASNIFRSLKFEDVTVNDALQTVANRFVGFLKFNTTFGGTYNEFSTSIDLRLPNQYNNFEFRYKKNTNGIKRIVDSSKGCYTRVYPEGRNNLSVASVGTINRTDYGTTYAEHEAVKGDIFNFQYFLSLGYTIAQCKDLFIRDFRFIEDAYTDATMLYDGGKRALEELSLPYVTYEIEGVDLSVIGVNTASFKVGDTIQVVDTDLGFDFRATVVSKTVNWDTPFSPSITLSNFTDKLGDVFLKMLKYQEAFSKRKALYGKAVSIVIADEATSRNWRYADYVVPADGSITAEYIINAAIQEVSDLGGGDVVLLDGKYIMTGTISMRDNVTLIGAGVSTELLPKSNIGLAIRSDGRKNITIKNLFINHSDWRFSDGIGIYAGSDNVVIENIIQEFVNNNMFIATEASNLSVRNNIFKSDTFSFTGSEVIDIKACSNARIEDNSILGKIRPFPNMINITDQIGISSGEFYIKNNYIYTTESAGISPMINAQVSSNAMVYIEDNTLICTHANGFGTGISTQNSVNVFINNNSIFTIFQFGGIYIGGEDIPVEASTTNIVCTNNKLYCATTSSVNLGAIRIDNTVADAKVQNNVVKRINPYNTSVAVLPYGIQNEGNRNLISGNDLYLSGTISSFLDTGAGTLTLGGNKL